MARLTKLAYQLNTFKSEQRVLKPPMCAKCPGYTDGSGVVRGFGRGLAGAVGLPVSGALAAIEALTSGIAAATGVSPIAVAQRAVPDPGVVAPIYASLASAKYESLSWHCQTCQDNNLHLSVSMLIPS